MMNILATADTFCHLPFNHIKINVNGDVNMCCFQGGFLGNILENSIEKIWNSPLAKEIREITLKQELHPCCKNWGGCPWLNGDLSKTRNITYYPYMPTSLELDLPSTHCNIG